MRKIELELDGVTVEANLLDQWAPTTCQALWNILPLEDRVVHSRWSGGRLHTTNHPKLGLEERRLQITENPSNFQAPGDLIVVPFTNEITISYAAGAYRWMGQQLVVTRVAVIEGDMNQFARKIERLQWEGAKKLVIRRGAESEAPKTRVSGKGAKVLIECEGKKWVGELFNDKASKLCQAILKALPLEGPITNMHSSGEVFHLWAEIPTTPEDLATKLERAPVDYRGAKIGTTGIAYFDPRDLRGTNPGDIMFNTMEGLRIVSGQVEMDQSLSRPDSNLGRFGSSQKVGWIIEGDLEELRAIADRIQLEGAKIMKVSRF